MTISCMLFVILVIRKKKLNFQILQFFLSSVIFEVQVGYYI